MPLTIPLAEVEIRSTLATTHLGQHLHIHRELPSTNTEAIALAQSGAPHGTVVVADRQTAGRGRQGRAWFSPPEVNLYCSVIIRPTVLRISHAEWLSWIPLVSALAAAEAVRTTAGIRLTLKWPNDLLCRERKVGGLLCENGTDHGKRDFVIVGIGLNVNLPPEALPEELTGLAGSLIEETHQPLDRNGLLSQFLTDLEPVLDELATRGARRLAHGYARACSTIGTRVRIKWSDSSELVGSAEGLGSDGALLVRPLVPQHGNGTQIIEVRAADVIHLRR
jgi:BirA family biotin operon repressor/biotin-[acetyl-CoA-carboxylase] ligase